METPKEGSSSGTSGRPKQWLTVPNLLSGLRLASVPAFLWLFAAGREEAAVVIFGLAAITDFFDGYIARRTGTITELGKLLDPLADRVAILALAVALLAHGTLPWWLAVAVVARDVLVLGAFPLLERRGVRRIPVNVVGKWGTGLLLAGLALLAYSETGFPLASYGTPLGLSLSVIGAVLNWAAGALYARAARDRLRSGTGRASGTKSKQEGG
jgi:cardiolipin synthase (CMP-forming)